MSFVIKSLKEFKICNIKKINFFNQKLKMLNQIHKVRKKLLLFKIIKKNRMICYKIQNKKESYKTIRKI